MLTRTRLNKFAGLMILLVPMAAMASPPSQRYAISPSQIADTLALAGLTVNVGQVELLSEVSTASDHAPLQVVSTGARAAGKTIVKIRCHDNHECLPFYIVVHTSQSVSGLQLASEKTALVEDTSFPRVVRGGDPAILILENGDSRIRMSVICLQNGSRGQKIRVASRDHRRFFEGEVVGTGMLKGSL
jgi:flagella basal body P-ring formation protein FlgA